MQCRVRPYLRLSFPENVSGPISLNSKSTPIPNIPARSVETLKATEQLAKLGFVVLPYIQADPVISKRLEGSRRCHRNALSTDSTNKDCTPRFLCKLSLEQSNVIVIVDILTGAPSHAAEAYGIGSRCRW